MRPQTRIQHHGDDREALGGGAAPPIFRTSLFTFPDCDGFVESFNGRGARSIYTRVSNPTTRILERKLADLEGTSDACAFASGMAAISATFLGLLGQGDHLIIHAGAYGPALAFARGPLRRFGVEVSFLEAAAFARLEEHLRAQTRLIYLESPASLTFELVDIAAAARLARARGIPTAIDNSWATPLYQQPCALGIDLALHSGTKYIGGHSDILLGIVAGGGEPFRKVREMAVSLGGTLSPEDAFLAIRGLRTLPLRLERHGEAALELARFLEGQARVRRVLHPGLESFPDRELAQRQLAGTSGLFSFVLDGDVRRFTDALQLFRIGVSWGGFESLILPLDLILEKPSERALRPDVPPGLIRLSVGLEDIRDLQDDLERGLAAC